MKSLCIKTDNELQIEHLINKLEILPMNICMSNYRFKIYDNIIVHYLENDIDEFYDILAVIIKELIEEFYEESLIMKSIKQNYFYLNSMEQEYICKITKKVLKLPDNKIGYKNQILKDLIKEYIKENKSVVIDGFVNFRIKKYKEIVDNIVEVSVFSYLDLTSF